MIGPEVISASLSLSTAVFKLAFREYSQGADARNELRRVARGLDSAQKAGFRRWLEAPSTQHQIESADPALRLAAEADLATAMADAGGAVPSHLGTYVLGAKDIYAAWKRPHELARTTQEIITDELRSLGEQIDRGALDITSEIIPLPIAVKRLLSGAAHVAEVRRVGQHLQARPSRGGLATDHLAVADPGVAEAVGLYAELRGWYREAADWYEAAAGGAAQPERLTLRAGFVRHRSGDADRARELVGRVPDHADDVGQLAAAVRSFVSDEDYTPSHEEIDWQVRDVDIVAALAVSGHHDVARDEACRIAEEWVRHHRDLTSLSVCASVYLSRALSESPRSQLVSRSLELALEAREVSHAAGMPAADATRTAIFAMVDLRRLSEIPVAYRASTDAGWVDVDFSDPETAALVRLASEVSGDDGASDVSLSPFHQRYFEFMGPVLSRKAPADSLDRNDLEELLGLASSESERSRALLALAHAGHLDEAGLERLAVSHPVSAAVIRSSHLLAIGDSIAAANLVRPHARGSVEAANQLCFVLDEAGSDKEFIDAALDGWTHHGDIVFFQQAADRIASATPPPPGAVQQLNRAASGAFGALVRGDRQAAYEHLIVANLNAGNIEEALSYARLLYEEGDSEHSRWRLALCHALAGEYDRAWKVLSSRHRQPLLRPRDDVERRLLATIVLQFADRSDQVRELLAARASDDVEVEGFCIFASQTATSRLEDPALGAEVQQALNEFTEANPDSEAIRQISVDLDDPVKALNELVRPRPVELERFDRVIAVGRLPYVYLTALTGRSIGALLVQRGPNWLFAAADGVAARARERKHAAAALRSGAVMDTTAMHVLAELRRLGSTELVGFLPVTTPTIVVQDAAMTRGDLPGHSIVIPKTGEPGIESIIELSEGDRTLQVERQQAIAELAESLTKRPVDGELIVAPHQHMNEHGRAAWSAAELARREDLPLWADDGALRQLLQQRGVASFNTRALIEVLRAEGHITNGDAAQAVDNLRIAHITDLPVPLPDLIAIARERRATLEHAVALRLPGWWAAQSNIRIERLATLFTTIATRQPEQLVAWFRCACVGATLANERHAQTVPALLAVVLLVHCTELRAHVDSLMAEASQALWPLSADLTVKGLVAALAVFIDPDPSPHEAARQLLAYLPEGSETHRRVTELSVVEKPGEA